MRFLATTVLLAAAFASASAQAAVITVDGTFLAADPTVNPRPFRNGIGDTCAAPKAFPGLSAVTAGYQSYSFFNSGPAECVTVMQVADGGASAVDLFVVAYGPGGFNPGNVASNYLADAGFSGPAQSYTFNVGANSAFTLIAFDVVNEHGSYTFSVTGDNLSRGSAPVPEPESIALLGIGMLAAASAARRRRSHAA